MSGQGQERKTIDLEDGWSFMEKGIGKLINILERRPEPQFNSKDYMMLYTMIYNMCMQKPPHDYSQQLYDKYREAFEKYINAMAREKEEKKLKAKQKEAARLQVATSVIN